MLEPEHRVEVFPITSFSGLHRAGGGEVSGSAKHSPPSHAPAAQVATRREKLSCGPGQVVCSIQSRDGGDRNPRRGAISVAVACNAWRGPRRPAGGLGEF